MLSSRIWSADEKVISSKLSPYKRQLFNRRLANVENMMAFRRHRSDQMLLMSLFEMIYDFLPGKFSAALKAVQGGFSAMDVHVLFLVGSLVEVCATAINRA